MRPALSNGSSLYSHRFPQSLGTGVKAGSQATLYWLMGFFVWFPAFAVHNLQSTGIQVVNVLVVLILVLYVFGRIKLSGRVALLLWLWALAITLSTAFSVDPSASIKGALAWVFSAFVMFVVGGILSGDLLRRRLAYIKGYLWGGAVSVLYAAYQLFALKSGGAYVFLLNNNKSFALRSDEYRLYIPDDPRPFGFTPESSVLSSLLVPALLYVVLMLSYSWRDMRYSERFGYSLLLLLYAAGLYVSTSLAIVVVPLVAVLVGFFVPSPRRYFSVALPLLIGVALLAVALVVWTGGVVAERLTSPTLDGSLMVRLASITTATRLFLENPIFGYGVGGYGERFSEIFPLFLLQAKSSVDSVPFLVASQLGILGIIALVATWGAVAARFKATKAIIAEEVALKGFVVATIVMFVVQTSSVFYYHYWIALGLGLTYGYKSMRKVS
jgi:hypothetical protein